MRTGENFNIQPRPLNSRQAEIEDVSLKDYRLKFHQNIPPPLPPKDSPLPSSDLLPAKPLPSVPPPYTVPLHRASQGSFESIELLDAVEILQRNEELEKERSAWREEARTGVGVDYNALRDRFSPCLRDPSIPSSSREADAVSDDAREVDTSPIRVHRMRNKDGSEHTVLVVHSRPDHPYANQGVSVSSPDLRQGRSVASRRVPFVKHFAQRLGSLATSRPDRSPSATGPKRSSASAQNDAHKSPQPTPATGRLFGKERKLVTDETVIIGKPLKPTIGAGMVSGQEDGKEQEIASQEGHQVLENATVHATRRDSLSRYRPAGTRDEIKAQLSEGEPSVWGRKSVSSLSAGEVHDAITWIDPGSNTIVQGNIILPSSFAAHRQEGETEELGSARSGRPLYSAWSDYTSRRGSNRTGVSEWGLEEALAGGPADVSGRSVSAELTEGEVTRTSSMSTETGDVVPWDASSVNLDDLFFRPP